MKIFFIKKKYKYYLFIFISLGSIFSQTYGISGRIIDFDEQKPLKNVNVFLENSDIGTVSDEDGSFFLLIKEKTDKRLKIKIIGYEEKLIPINKLESNFCQGCSHKLIELEDVFLVKSTIAFDPIHVHGLNTSSDQISDIYISGKELANNLNSNIAKTLENYPNIGMSSFGISTAKPVLRGFSGERFLLTKDGNLLGDLSQTSIDHCISLDLTEINKIEIIRGPKSLLFGSNSIGGVINTHINGNPKQRFKNFTLLLKSGIQSFNDGLFGNLFFFVPYKSNNQINFSLNTRKTKNQNSPIGEIKNTYLKLNNYKIGYTRYFMQSYIQFLLENYVKDYGVPPSEEGHINGVDISLIKNTYQINYHTDISINTFTQLDIKYNFIDYEHGEYESNSDFRAVGLQKHTHNTKIEFKSDKNTIGSEIDYKISSSEGFYWTPKAHEIKLSMYGLFEKNINSLRINGSFRLGQGIISPIKPFLNFSNINEKDVINRSFPFISTSFGFNLNINNYDFSSWVMNTMRVPSLEELYSDGPHLGTYAYEIGTPNLKSEEIYGIETAIKYTKNPFEFKLITFYNYSPYYYQMNQLGECNQEYINGQNHPCAGADFIEWGSGASGWLYKYQAKGVESVIKGLEYNFKYDFNNYKISYDYSITRGENLSAEKPLSSINPDKQIVNFTYRKNLIDYNLRFIRVNSQTRLGEFEKFTPAYSCVDFKINFNFNNQLVTIQLNNIFDKLYYNHLSAIKSIKPESGRNFVVNYRYYIF